MKNKEYFGKITAEKKLVKKIIISGIALLLIFIPTFFVLINYISENEDDQKTDDEITVGVYYNEQMLFEETSTKQNALPTGLVSIFDSILNGMTEISSNEIDLSANQSIVITFDISGVTSKYTCYFFTDGSDSNILIDEKGQMFKIAKNDAILFLSSTYAQSLYNTATPPKLYTTSDDVVLPNSADWYYKNISQKHIQAIALSTTSDTVTYDMAGALGINFDIEPDSCLIQVYKSGIIFHESSSTDLSMLTVKPGTTLKFKIKAIWNKNDTSEFYGTLEYEFDAVLRDRSDFTINKSELSGGDFLVLSCTNILDLGKIEFSSTPDIYFKPRFFQSNDMVYALIPFSTQLTEGTYSLTFTYGASTETMSVTLNQPKESIYTLESTAKDQYFMRYTSTTSLSEFANIMDSLEDTVPEYLYFNGSFYDYEESYAIEKYGFNTQFIDSKESKKYRFYGTVLDFGENSGQPVKAANNGRVVNCGYSEYLGNFVILDHGLGLRTIYGHLSALNVEIGDVLLKGQSIGRCGQINGTTDTSLVILTYIFDIAIDYGNISGLEISLYRTNTDTQ